MISKASYVALILIMFKIICTDAHNFKIVDFQAGYHNPKYVLTQSLSSKVIDVNATYSTLSMTMQFLKPLTQDVTVIARFIAYYKGSDIGKRIKTVTIEACNLNCPNRIYFPRIVQELTKTGKCFGAGNYNIKGFESLNFYELFSEEELKNVTRMLTIYSLTYHDEFVGEIYILSAAV